MQVFYLLIYYLFIYLLIYLFITPLHHYIIITPLFTPLLIFFYLPLFTTMYFTHFLQFLPQKCLILNPLIRYLRSISGFVEIIMPPSP